MLSADFFFKITFSKNSLRNTIIVSNGLDSDQSWSKPFVKINVHISSCKMGRRNKESHSDTNGPAHKISELIESTSSECSVISLRIWSVSPDPSLLTYTQYRGRESQAKDNTSYNMRFPTKWYVRLAKPQISLRICAV